MKLTFEYDTEEEKIAAGHFISWLSGQGEQDYWTWMEYRESEEYGNITIRHFDYDYEDHKAICAIGRITNEV